MYNHIIFSLFKLITVRFINLIRYQQINNVLSFNIQIPAHNFLVRDFNKNYKF